MKLYDMVVTRENDWWALTIEELGLVGLVEHLDNGRETARSRMAAFLDVDEDDINVIMHAQEPGDVPE